MAKLTLSNITSLQNEQSATNLMNLNSAAVVAAMENTLSRDGTSPNAMEADFDMNDNHILNLPVPADPTSPIRKDQFDELVEDTTGVVAEVADLLAQTQAAAAEALVTLDNFEDVYLGAKSADPLVDNDGDALVEGQLYWNSTANNLRVYDGASWAVYSAQVGISNVVDDTSPSLGGDLDMNSQDIIGTGNVNITGSVTVTDDAYAVGWNGSSAVPTKNAVYDKIEGLSSTYQPLDATLTSLAAYNTDGLLTQTAANTFTGRTLTGTAAQITVTNGTGVAGNPTLSLPSDVLIPTVLTVPNTGLHILDTNASHDLIIAPGSNITADRTLTLTTGDADRTLTLSGNVTLISSPREVLTGARTYYVRTDGSDSNTGLADNSGGAFLTIQKAINTVGMIDLAGFACTIQVRSGTYTGGVNASVPFIGGIPTLIGDATTPSNVIISTTSNNAILVANNCILNISGLKLQTTTSGTCVSVTTGGIANLTGTCDFGASAGNHVSVVSGGAFVCLAVNYNITGAAATHVITGNVGNITISNNTITITGTPAFATAFAYAQNNSVIQMNSNTFSGSATGARYSANTLSTIQTFGGGATYLPGNSAGSTGTGGQYA
jgi:hypothetical protein